MMGLFACSWCELGSSETLLLLARKGDRLESRVHAFLFGGGAKPGWRWVNLGKKSTSALPEPRVPTRTVTWKNDLSTIKTARTQWWLALTAHFLLAASAMAQTNTVAVTALTDASCVGTRAGSTRSCTSNDFDTIVSFEQESAGALSKCVYGESLTLNIRATVASKNPDRYDVGVFFGQTGNSPRINDASQLCSIGMVAPTTIIAPQTFPPPSTPTIFPFFDSDLDACGDFRGKSFGAADGYQSGVATMVVRGVKVACMPATGSNVVGVPYTVVFDNVSAGSCTTGNITAGTNAKCSSNDASTIIGLETNGYVRVTKQTLPSSATETFAFTASASSTPSVAGDTPSTTSFSLGHAQTQQVTVPLHSSGGTRTLVIQESLLDRWGPGAAITCTTPAGGSASFVTVDTANRRITANLSNANGAAHCTISNTKQTRVKTDKALQPNTDAGRFNLTAGGATVTNQGHGGTTGWQAVTPGTPVTYSETGFGGTQVAGYGNTYRCSNADTGAVLSTGSGTSTSLTSAAYTDTLCLFTNRVEGGLSVTKSNSASSLVSGGTTQYAITVNNSGPSNAAGATVSDPASAGLSCYAATCQAVVGPPTATCPASVTVAALQTGLVIPDFPANSSLVFNLSCNVTASGQP